MEREERKPCDKDNRCGLGKIVGGRYICIHNNLTISHPHLISSWNYDKNKKKPEEYSFGSAVKVWWKCDVESCCPHEWESPINTRTKKVKPYGCPYCSGKAVCKHNSLLADNPILCEEWNPANEKNPDQYAPHSHEVVSWICRKNPCGCHIWSASIDNRNKGEKSTGCPYCSPTNKKICPHYNLSTEFPEICLDWDYDRNKLGPENYAPFTHEKVWWKCHANPCGCHEGWFAEISGRTAPDSRGCPSCSLGSKIICPHRNLLALYPKICREWHNDRNNDKKPEDFLPGSHEQVWWKCHKNPLHEWQTSINNRTHKTHPSNCPHCNTIGYSKKQIIWLEWIMKEQNIKIQHALSPGGEYKIKGIGRIGKVDGRCENTIYEFYGDFYHGNPSLYNREDINGISKKSYGELYDKTINKEERIKAAGYNLITIWESDFDKLNIDIDLDFDEIVKKYQSRPDLNLDFSSDSTSESDSDSDSELTQIIQQFKVDSQKEIESKQKIVMKPFPESIQNIRSKVISGYNKTIPLPKSRIQSNST